MLGLIKPVWALFFGILMLMVGQGLQGTLLGIRATFEGFLSLQIGLVMSSYYGGMLLGAAFSPQLVRHYGHVRVFAAMASLASIGVLIYPVFIDWRVWFIMRMLHGYAMTSLYVVAESWLNNLAQNATRGRLLSFYMLVQYAGLVFGNLTLNLASPESFLLFTLVSILVSLALIPMMLSEVHGPYMASPSKMPLGQLYRASPLGIVGIFLTGLLLSLFFGMGAVLGSRMGLSSFQISIMVSLYMVGGFGAQWPVGVLSDRLDRRGMMLLVLGVGCLAVVLCLIGMADGFFWLFYTGCFVFGCSTLPLYSLVVAHANDFLENDQMVSASGTLYIMASLGSFLGPILVGQVLDLAGPVGFFVFYLIGQLVFMGYILYRVTRRKMPEELKTASSRTFYLPPRATPISASLHPEADLSGPMDSIMRQNAPASGEDGSGEPPVPDEVVSASSVASDADPAVPSDSPDSGEPPSSASAPSDEASPEDSSGASSRKS